MMLSKKQLKFIKSLDIKKFRAANQAFLVQGEKRVLELLDSQYETKSLYVTDEFMTRNKKAVEKCEAEVVITNQRSLEQAGTLKSNSQAIAVAEILPSVQTKEITGKAVYLDDIRDPGNLGTIIRTLDWYGFTEVYMSPECADFYNPKVISASMGSFIRVTPQSISQDELKEIVEGSRLIVADMNGQSVHSFDFGSDNVLVIGNESNGPSDVLTSHGTTISIDRVGGAESLNAGIATAIILDRWTLR